MSGWRRDLRPLRPEDAAALRRYAEVLEQRHPNKGWVGEVITGILAKTARGTADRLDAGDMDGTTDRC